jgi:hypothetical protein
MIPQLNIIPIFVLNLPQIFIYHDFFPPKFYVFGAEVGGEVLQYIPSPLSLILLLFLRCSCGLR